MADQTENQAKARELLKMLNDNGLGTLAGEVKSLLEEAWSEGRDEGRDLELENGYGGQTNPYLVLGLG